MKRTVILTPLFLFLLFSCVRKKDFAMDKVKWDEITPTWGLPLVNSTLTISDALDINTSDLVIQRDPDGFITFIYLDTVNSPLGEALFDEFKFPSSFPFQANTSLGTIPVPFPPNTALPHVPPISGFIPFEMDSVQSITKITIKTGKLDVSVQSFIRHDLDFTLVLPDLKNSAGTAYTANVELNYVKGQIPNHILPTMDLTGYTLSAATGKTNQISYEIKNISITTKSDNGTTSNPIADTDSLKLSVNLSQIKYKTVQGKFLPLHIRQSAETSFMQGNTDINAFDNAVRADIRLQNPSVTFDFQNSFGITPIVNIQEAVMMYSYGKPNEQFTVSSSSMIIPGITTINAVPVSQIGQSVTTNVLIDRNTSNITTVLQGAPNKFTYNIPFIALTSPSNGEGFISDDSQIKIYTQVKLPLFGAISELVITDSIRNVEMPKADNVEYIEFRVGSDNSIPTSIRFQAYFIDTNQKNPLDTSRYVIIDSLINPPKSDMVVAPGAILETDLAGNITKTENNTFYTTLPVSKERYKKIAKANLIAIKGTLMTKDADKSKTVKFFTWQTCTFKLSALAKVRIDPANPEEITNIGK